MKKQKTVNIVLGVIVSILLLTALGITIYKKIDEKNKKYSKEKVLEIYKSIKYDEKLNVYLFYGEECPHCENELKFLNSLDSSYKDKYNFYKFETWHNENNKRLRELVVDRLLEDGYIIIEVESQEGIDVKETEAYKKELDGYYNAVPFIIIGNKNFIGYGEKTGEYIKEAILEQYDYDVMKKLDLK